MTQAGTEPRVASPESPGERLGRLFGAISTARTDGELFEVLGQLDQLAAESRGVALRNVRHPACLLAAWVAAELGEVEASADWLDLLRGEGHSEAEECRMMLPALEACIAARSFERAQRTADWILAEIASQPRFRAQVLLSQEWVLRATGQYLAADAALNALECELDALRAADAPPELVATFEARLRLSRAQAWLSLGVLDRAAEELGQGLAAARGLRDPAPLVAATLAYCDLSMLQDKRRLALQLAEGLLEERGDALPPELKAPVLLQRATARAELSRREPELRLEVERELRALPEMLGPRLDLIQRARLELADLLLREDPAAAAREEAAELLNSIDPEQGGGLESVAFATSLRARLTLAGEPTAAELGRAIETTERAFERMLEEWRHSPRRRGGLGFLQISYRRMLISALIDLQLAHGQGQRALEVILRAQAEGALVAELGGGAVDLESLRTGFLEQEHGCLVFLPGRHKTHLFAFDRGSLLHVPLPQRLELLEALDAFHSRLFSPPGRRAQDGGALLEQLERDAHQLAELLFDTETRELIHNWKRVTVVGSELLKGLPVECLPLGPEGELLGLTHAVDVVPSLPLAARLRELDLAAAVSSAAADAPRLVLIADLAPARAEADMRSVTPGELAPSLASLAQPFEGSSAVLTGDDATWAELARQHATGPVDVLQILAHGTYDRSRELGAALALRTDIDPGSPDRVFAEDIERLGELGRGARVVVLSVCASARGPERLGLDNLTHLGGAFLRAGSRCVILTRAKILLGPTLRLDRALHEGLAEGLTAAEALRRARFAALDDDDPFSPYLAGRVQAYGWGSLRLR